MINGPLCHRQMLISCCLNWQSSKDKRIIVATANAQHQPPQQIKTPKKNPIQIVIAFIKNNINRFLINIAATQL